MNGSRPYGLPRNRRTPRRRDSLAAAQRLLSPHPDALPRGEYLFRVLPASCRQNETMRDRKTCRRDAGSTLERHHEAPLNRNREAGTASNAQWRADGCGMFSGHRRAHPLPKGEYVFSALRTRHVRSESAGLAVAAAFGVRQLVGAFARGMGGSAANWLALAEDSGDKSPHSKRWRDCKTAACVPTPGLCDALNRYKGEGWGKGKRCEVPPAHRTHPGIVELDESSSRAGGFSQ